jgi:hypothetical protein
MAGFEFRESMSGSYRLDASPDRERAISFTVGGRVDHLLKFARDRIAHIQGAIDMEGFAAHRAARGTMLMDPILGRTVGYELTFVDDDGHTRRLSGRKSVEFLRFMKTMTTLPAEILDENGKRIGEATLRFDVRSDLVRFLRSFRPQRLAY